MFIIALFLVALVVLSFMGFCAFLCLLAFWLGKVIVS